DGVVGLTDADGKSTTVLLGLFFFSSRRRHTRCYRDWSSDVCSSDLRRRPDTGKWTWPKPGKRNRRRAWRDRVSGKPEGARHELRSEERRVGKECGSRRGREHET